MSSGGSRAAALISSKVPVTKPRNGSSIGRAHLGGGESLTIGQRRRLLRWRDSTAIAARAGVESGRLRRFRSVARLLPCGLLAVVLAACDAGGRLPVYTPVGEVPLASAALRDCLSRYAQQRGWRRAGEVVELHCNHPDGGGVERLEGIDRLPNLRVLNLAHNRIAATEPLWSLQRLEDLDLGYNRITFLEPPSAHLSLLRLNLDHNAIRRLDWLAQFPRLTNLSLAHNEIRDLRPLATAAELTDLNLERNRIDDLAALAQLGQLRWLDIRGNEVAELAPLARLAGLKSLIADDNRIRSVAALATLAELDELSLAGNPLESADALAGLANLRVLILDRTPLPTVRPLAVLGNLQRLSIRKLPKVGCEERLALRRELGADVVQVGAECAGGP
ncbi:MAG: leucine-rich repeat domain-containing protein [Gammaproteobacteria bacterium]|nr:MAG: leucine-rich repeat domain-containing protein [Gammaproteobacteria bacterium]